MRILERSDPTAIGSYRLLARIGEGGMGRVYLADAGSQLVAVKVMREELARDDRARRRFGHEIDATLEVSSPFLPRFVDGDPDAELPWLATAYVPGPSLDRVLQTASRLPADVTAAVLAGVAQGLSVLHAHGLVHRDLKPANVLVEGTSPTIIDLGIAKDQARATQLTTAHVPGTLAWQSPEQLRGEEVGPPSDVFNLGLMLVTLASGRHPFPMTGGAVAIPDLTAEADLSGLDPRLADLAGVLLAEDPGDRPAAAEAARVLDVLSVEVVAEPVVTSARTSTPRSGGVRRSEPPAGPEGAVASEPELRGVIVTRGAPPGSYPADLLYACLDALYVRVPTDGPPEWLDPDGRRWVHAPSDSGRLPSESWSDLSKPARRRRLGLSRSEHVAVTRLVLVHRDSTGDYRLCGPEQMDDGGTAVRLMGVEAIALDVDGELPARHGAAWSREEREGFLRASAKGLTLHRIAEGLERRPSALVYQLQELGHLHDLVVAE